MFRNMNQEKIPENSSEQEEKKQENPNKIFEMLLSSPSQDISTTPDKVYRMLRSYAAIEDLEKSGVVRNRQAAGLIQNHKYGEKVYWTKGKNGGYMSVSEGSYVIETSLSVAEERVVKKEDITAIYTKNQEGVIDTLKERREGEIKQRSEELLESERRDEEKIKEIRKDLSLE